MCRKRVYEYENSLKVCLLCMQYVCAYKCVCMCMYVRQRDHYGILSEPEQDRRCFPSRMLGRFETEGSEQRGDENE